MILLGFGKPMSVIITKKNNNNTELVCFFFFLATVRSLSSPTLLISEPFVTASLISIATLSQTVLKSIIIVFLFFSFIKFSLAIYFFQRLENNKVLSFRWISKWSKHWLILLFFSRVSLYFLISLYLLFLISELAFSFLMKLCLWISLLRWSKFGDS